MHNHGADPNPDVPARNSLNMMAAYASIDTLRLLFERGADPCKSNALRFAIERDDNHWKEVMEVLLDHGADIDAFEPQGFHAMRGDYSGSVLHIVTGRNRYDRVLNTSISQ